MIIRGVMDKTIANTFNAFYALKWGKSATGINFKLMSYLCKAQGDPELKQIMTDILDAFRPWINKEEQFTREDFEKMSDVANELHKKYIYHDDIFPIIAEVYIYIDRRETARHGRKNNDTAD